MKKYPVLKAFVEGRGYTREEWDELDCPDATAAELEQVRPFKEAFPVIHAAIMRELNKSTPTISEGKSKMSAAA
jgi:hypothetical protein